MMEGWEHAAQTMLAHFRAVSDGNTILAMDLQDEEIRKTRKLDETAVTYLKSTQEVLMRRGKKTYSLLVELLPNSSPIADDLRAHRTKSPGNPLVWISALFIPPDVD